MARRRIVVVDFETEAIGSRSGGHYPPVPVGVAIRESGRNTYLAWGHDSENNATRNEALRALRRVWHEELVFHNASFDIEVAMTHFDLPWPEVWQDTLIMAYLADPRSPSFGLKELAAYYLDMPPDEQDDLRDWILANVKGSRKSDWGAYIARAPATIAGRYAIGDVVRTGKLFTYLKKYLRHPLADQPGVDMLDAYERECELIRVKVAMERRGIRCATERLEKEIPIYHAQKEAYAQQLRRKLKVTKAWEAKHFDDEWNVDSAEHLADALEHSGYVSARNWVRTKTGKRSTSRANLEACIKDEKLRALLNCYTVTSKYLSTFLEPWHLAAGTSGYIHPSFNTTRSTSEAGSYGTTTGRLSSSSPNFQNIPASVNGSAHEAVLRIMQKDLKRRGVDFIGLRDYLIPDEGCVFLNRDYSQQEFRILAHYETGELLSRYAAEPEIDFHSLVQRMVEEASGTHYERKPIKNINFGIIYGMGAALLASKIGISVDEAKYLKNLILSLVPGIARLQKDLKKIARVDHPISTHGGRLYYCEPDQMINGERRSFDYKLLNLLIQGSAADCTKQAMLQVADAAGIDTMVLQVHDELMLCVPREERDEKMRLMREAMEDMQYDVPMITEGKWGEESWARMKPYQDKR